MNGERKYGPSEGKKIPAGENCDDRRMKTEEYLETVTSQIRCRMARAEAAEELRAHIEDQTRAYLSEGMERDEAELLAVREMGDPVTTGNELDRIHRPKMPWGMIALITALSFAGYLAMKVFEQRFSEAAGEQMNGFGNADRQLFFLLAGLIVMMGICFLDYTRIAAHAEWALAGLIVFAGAGKAFFGLSVNGAERWIGIGWFTVNIGVLMLLTIPLYAAVLYNCRGGGIGAVGKAVFWMLPGSLMTMVCGPFWVNAVLVLTYLILFGLAAYRKWFRIPRKRMMAGLGAAVVLLPAAAVFFRFLLSGLPAGYQIERLKAIFNLDGYSSYGMDYVREWLAGSRLLGAGQNLPDLAAMPGPEDSLLAWIAGYYGILAALAAAGALLFLLFRFFRISLKQRNQLGMIMGAGCSIAFLTPTLSWLLNNLGITRLGGSSPFFTSGGSATLVNAVLFGLLLSICRYRNTAPERRPAGGILKNIRDRKNGLAE